MTARQRAVDAALNIFSHYGFRQASMELVAERLGITRQALYRHFASKEALLAAVVEDLHAGAIAAAQATAAEQSALAAPLAVVVTAALHARFEFILTRLAASPHAPELLEEHQNQCGPIIANYAQRFIALLEHLIEEQVRDGRYRLRDGLTATDLGRYLFLLARALKSEAPPSSLKLDKGDLARLVTIIVAGGGEP